MPKPTVTPASMALATCLFCGPLSAQDVGAPDGTGAHLSIELNAMQQADEACRISFLVRNGHDRDIEKAVFEAVLFDSEGRVERLTLFDFGALPSARPRARQFLVPGLACAALGRLLINGAETCRGENLPDRACDDGLELRSRTDVEMLG